MPSTRGRITGSGPPIEPDNPPVVAGVVTGVPLNRALSLGSFPLLERYTTNNAKNINTIVPDLSI